MTNINFKITHPSHERQRQGLVQRQQAHPRLVSFRTSIRGSKDGSIHHSNLMIDQIIIWMKNINFKITHPSHEHQRQHQGLVQRQQSHPQPVSFHTIYVHSSKDGSILYILTI